MKTRAVLGILAAAGLATTANAQESVSYTLTWSEVNAGTGTAVAVPNGQIDPGEGARISISVNITPGIGSTATYTPPPPPGSGTIAGLGSIFFDLTGTNLNGGTWSSINRNPGGTAPNGVLNNWTLGDPGVGQANGNLLNAQAGQFVLPGSTANNSNPVNQVWRGTWNPSSYAARTASFLSSGALPASGNHSSILIQYGLDAGGNPQYVGKFVSGTFGGSGNIPIAPSPSSLALLGLGALVAGRRRR
jgi:uncharacterized protein (TIGR03382 family)